MKTEYKIIADHLRSSCFLIADGALPSNEGRGYVLRRIMRRAMLQLHKIGTCEASMHKFVDVLIKEMGDAYPELVWARAVIIETLKNEEEKFRETLEKGLKILEEEISTRNTKILSGNIAFKLYDTYGFPLDLTQTILKEKNIEIDISGFENEMEKQRQRAKASWSGSGDTGQNAELLKLKEEISATEFLGYNLARSDATILGILLDGKKVNEISAKNNGQNIFIILDKTPFYATSGGQKGDDGKLKNCDNEIEISTTQKIDNLFLHIASKISGNFKVGEKISAQINLETRHQRACNHSTTHLIHKALKLILGNSISQKGSNVDANYFTFDFNYNRAMTTDEITQVEDLVNFYIAQNSPTQTKIMTLDEARKAGAEALFGEKYDNEVRVVTMGITQDNSAPYSIELCGGTHIKSTGEIQFFKIISEKSIASGIRRIEAKTGDEAKNFVINELLKLEEENFNKANKIAEFENKKTAQTTNFKENIKDFDYKKIKEKIVKLRTEIIDKDNKIKILNKKIEQEKTQNLLQNLDNLTKEKVGDVFFIHKIFTEIDTKDLREITLSIKSKADFRDSCIFAFFANMQDKVAVTIAICDNLLEKYDANTLIKDVVAEIGGKGGGGKKDFAMGGGTDASKIASAIEIVKNKIK